MDALTPETLLRLFEQPERRWPVLFANPRFIEILRDAGMDVSLIVPTPGKIPTRKGRMKTRDIYRCRDCGMTYTEPRERCSAPRGETGRGSCLGPVRFVEHAEIAVIPDKPPRKKPARRPR